MTFVRSILHLMSGRAKAQVNDPRRSLVANLKPIQLLEARRLGFKIPATLISNDAEAVLEFSGSRSGRLIHKSFSPYSWAEEAGTESRHTYTQFVDAVDLSAEVLRLCPAIYQDFIAPREEIRAVVVGRDVYAVAVRSQGKSDSRKDRARLHVPLEYDLSAEEKDRMVQLVQALGLSCATMDLIRSEDGELFFLELNEGGQWIFMERENPHLKILDAFSNSLLLAGSYRDRPIPVLCEVSAPAIVDEIVRDRAFLRQVASA